LVADASGATTDAHKTESYSLYEARGNRIRLLHSEQVAAHLAGLSTLGFLYEYLTRKAGFVTPVGPDLTIPEPGKLMGLAPYGRVQQHWHPWIRFPELGAEHGGYSLGISAYDIFLEVAALEKRYGAGKDDGQTPLHLHPWRVDLAYKVQQELEQALLYLVEQAVRQTGVKKLCLAGGVALNAVANYRLQQQLQLEEVFTFPAAGDAGIAAGCALWAYATGEKRPQRKRLRSATLGHSYSEEEIHNALKVFTDRIEVKHLGASDSVEKIAQALAQGHIIARFQGGSEYGPRALGHRSILADPTFEKMRDILNARVKFREPFRPFAPVIPQEAVSEVFEQEISSPFMLLIAAVHPEYRARIPSVTHVDGSSRIQTVTAQENPWLHSLCHKIATLRGDPPVILNTSFNLAGQPIVETPAEAIETFLATDIDMLLLEDYRITKPGKTMLGYEAHLRSMEEPPLPHGLDAGQPAVTDLMRQLDRALFFGEPEGAAWSLEELRGLAATGGRYKETSLLFPDNPFSGPFHTRLARDTILLLDPLGYSQLVDVRGRQEPLACSMQEVRLLMTLLNCSSGDRLESLRREQQTTPSAWTRQISQGLQQLRRFGLEPRYHAPLPPADDRLPVRKGGERTLAPFAEPHFHIGSLLEEIRAVFDRAGYTEEAIRTALGVESPQQIKATWMHYYGRFHLPRTDLADLIRLFLLRTALPRERLEELFGTRGLETLIRLGIIAARDKRAGACVDIYPVEGLYLATDHRYMLLRDDRIDEDPVMYIGLDSLGLVCTAPRYPVDRLLDLGTGSGVQALVSSRYAGQVTGVDINPRAVRFARFNAQLNGIRNIRFIEGDLYDVVADTRFDIILANPPFVPSPDQNLGFRDGGVGGEAVLARIVTGAAHRLTRAGKLHIVSDLVDVESYEQRLATWWSGGPADRLILKTANRDEAQFSIPHAYMPFGQDLADYHRELERWIENFRAAGVKRVNFGYILLHRLPDATTGSYCVRTIHSPSRPIHAQVKQYFRQQALLQGPHNADLFVRINREIVIRTEMVPGDGSLRYGLHADHNPLYTTYAVDPPIIGMLHMIATTNPSLGSLRNSDRWDQVRDLLHKGILYLSLQAGPKVGWCGHSLEGFAGAPQGAVEKGPGTEIVGIRELESQTTPTCLSSYIRRW